MNAKTAAEWLELATAFRIDWDRRLAEANGWPEKREVRDRTWVYLERREQLDGTTRWIIHDQAGCVLALPAPGDKSDTPISFIYDSIPSERTEEHRRCTRFASKEEALEVWAKYLSQPINPYLWAREAL